MKKTAGILALSLAFTLALTGCGGSGSTAGSSAAETNTNKESASAEKEEAAAADEAAAGSASEVTISVNADPVTLYPWGSTNEGRNLTRLITYETLCFKDENYEIQNCLAKNVEQSGDRSFDIEIYDYIYDTNGNHMTASDVLFSLQMAIDDGNNASSFTELENMEQIDDYTVRLTFTDMTAGCCDQITTNIYIITEAAWEQSADEMALDPIGTSPYKLTDYVTGSYYEYTRTGNYWQTDESLVCVRSKDNVEKVTYRIYTDKSTAAIALENGEIDSSTSLNSADLVNFCDVDNDYTALEGYTTTKRAGMAVIHLTYNCSDDSPCSDINLRKAISTAIDSATIADTIFGGLARAPHGYAHSAMVDYPAAAEEGDYYDYNADLEQAKEYLAQSGYNGETLVMIVNPEADSRVATMVQAYCGEIGVNIEIQNYETAIYQSYHTSEDSTQFDIDLAYPNSGSYTWGKCGELDPANYSNGLNHCYINDEELNARLAAAKYTAVADVEAAKELVDYIDEQCYVYALYELSNLVVTNDKFATVVCNHSFWIIPGACDYNY